MAELRWLLCSQSFLRYCKSHRSAQDPSGYFKNTETIFKCHPGCWEGWDLPWGWLVRKGRQCQQRSNQRWSCLCFTAIDILFSILATAVVNILSFDLDVHNQVISSALPLRWVLWWLPTWMQLELSLPISSLQGNARWWLLCYQLCTSRCICRCIHTLIQWELSSTAVGYHFFANLLLTATHFSTSPVSTQGNHINLYSINAMNRKHQNPTNL